MRARRASRRQELQQGARHQLRARLVFENDSITNIAHQLGYFETIASWRTSRHAGANAIEAVTLDQVAAVAARRLAPANRTIGWFAQPQHDRRDDHRPAARSRAVRARCSPTASSSSRSRRRRRRRSRIHASIRAGSVFDPPGSSGRGAFRVADDRPRHRDADRRSDRRGARQPRRVAVRRGQPPRDVARRAPAWSRTSSRARAPRRHRRCTRRFPTDEVETRRGEIITLIRQDEDNPAAVAGEGADGDCCTATTHPYGRRPRGTVETVETHRRAPRCSAFHARALRAGALSLVHGRRHRAAARDRRGGARRSATGRRPPAAASSLPRWRRPPPAAGSG